MEIKAAEVGKLRKMTGAGMMDCKRALIEAEGDFERAKEIIRETGKLIANKRADRDATEGVMVSKIVDEGTKGYILCLACETDFVSKNESFKAIAEEIFAVAIANDVNDLETLKAIEYNGATIAALVTEKSGQTGEKIEIAYYAKVEADQVASYVHINGKLGTLVGFSNVVDAETAKDITMQAAAMAPISISKDDCPADVIEKERQIGREQARLEGKPEAILDKIADGKVKKFLADNTLLCQAFVKNPKITVEEHIKASNPEATVVVLKRFTLND